MHAFALLLLVVISAGHGSSEAAKEVTNPEISHQESIQEPAPSRVKRGNRDMYRLTRGLQMLRLGKRADSPYDDDVDGNGITTLEDRYLDSQLYPFDTYPEPYDPLPSLEDVYTSKLRIRRSTPSDDAMVTPIPSVDDGSDVDVLPDDLNDGDSYILYPELYYGDDGNGDGTWDEAADGGVDAKRSLSMLRLGKRQLPMLRLGKRGDEDEKRSLSMLRLGKRQMENVNSEYTQAGEKRSLSMLRLGKKRNLNMLRLGKRGSEEEKRNLNMLRLGRKRNLNMLRLGKRNLNMLRLGKRNLNMLRLGKRNLNMLRLGKRNLNMLRLGKRNLNMLRLGKREDLGNDEEVKRNLQMLRLGKRSIGDSDASKKE